MKFSCTQLSLVKALSTVEKAISTRTTYPILKCVLLEVKNNELILTASDVDLSIETKIEVQGYEEGVVAVNEKLFGDIIRKLPSAIVKMEEVNGKFMIFCLGSEFSIVTMPAGDFPGLGKVNELHKITINREILKNLIRKTSFAASSDEKKGNLTGCLLSFENGFLEMAALDGFRLAVARAPMDCENKKIIVPARILNEIGKILGESSINDVSLVIDEKRAEVFVEETRIVIRLLEGDFIRYKDIIPSEYKTRVIVSSAEMSAAIERASLLAKEGKNNLIKLDIKDSSVEISSRSEEGNVKENISAEIEGNDILIGFNSKYISDVLRVSGDEEISIEMTSAVSACILKPISGDEYLYLVLPVRISVN